jgi:SWI/SNF-related matrix-associated actin-dependent regulator 1 of chromatin subfamily A
LATDLFRLLPFQVEGAQFLAARKHAFLADEMGIGKTAQAIHACDLVGAMNVLVLVPASARVNWLREFDKFSPFDRPSAALMDGKGHISAQGVTVCSYDMIAGNVKLRKSLLARQWDVIILDEAHYLKSRTAGRTKAVYGRKSDGMAGLSAVSKQCWRLSGTPAPNNVSELWTHLHAAGIYTQGFYNYVTEFCTGFDSDYGFKITGTKNESTLKDLIHTFLLRRKKKDVMPELPALSFEQHEIEPSPVDAQVHFPETLMPGGEARFKLEVERQNTLLRSAWNHGQASRHGNTLDMLQALAPSLGTLRRWIGMAKVPGYLKQVHRELRLGRIDKLVIFAYNKMVIEALSEGLRDFGVVRIYGGTPAPKRQHHIDRFQTDPECRVFVGQLQAAGTAVTLTAAHRVDVIQQSYVPGENAQAIMRCHRKGQEHPVLVRWFSCARSIDIEITRAHMRKAEELSKVFT